MQADHSRELMAVQARHITETAAIKKRYEKNVSFFQMSVRKASALFPHFYELPRMYAFCHYIRFDE